MGDTISGTYTTGAYAASAADNPVLVTGFINDTYFGHGLLVSSHYGVTNWTVTNEGYIASQLSGSDGVFIDTGGTVINDASHTIRGDIGVSIENSTGTVVNYGVILGNVGTTFHDGVLLPNGGVVINHVGGTINGASIGIDDPSNGSLVVTNYGLVTAGGDGVFGFFPTSVTNQSGGTIAGGSYGVALRRGGTVVNAGLISGSTKAVHFTPGYTSSVVIEPGASFTGTVDGGNTIGAAHTSTLELASGASTGTLSGLGTLVVNFAQTTIAAGAQWTLNNGTLVSGATLTNSGSVYGVISLLGTARATNAAGGTMSGSPAPLYGAAGSSPSVTNGGLLSATGTHSAGVALFGGGYIHNQSTGTIVGGGIGIFITLASTGANAGSVINDGYIGGISDEDGGTIFNRSTGIIVGTKSGISLYFANPTSQSALVINSGSVSGGSGHSGIYLPSGGIVSNTGTITGGSGGINFGTAAISGSVGNSGYIASTGTYAAIFFDQGNGTVNNDGTIGSTTATGDAIDFASGATNRLIDDPSAVFNGVVNGGGSGTLELATGSGAGTISGLDGTEFGSFTDVQIDAHASWQVQGGIPGGETVAFAGTGATLQLANPTNVVSSVTNFVSGDTIDLVGISPSSVNFSSGVLSFTGGSFPLSLSGISGVQAVASADGAAVVVCFRAGTRIATERGEVAVEALAIDDSVQLASGRGYAPARWIGRRRVDCSRHPEPRKVWPVRVSKDAFGEGRPQRDLWLSPDHAVFVDGVLIPVRYLINGRSIVQVPVDDVTYYHVELPCHDVLLAEGLPVESYLDAGNRQNFANGEGPIALHADFASEAWEAAGCAPLVVTGPILDGVRRRLERREAA
jgi:Hint domain